MLSKALVEVPIKAKVESVRTQKNSQAYKKTSCTKQDFVCRSKEMFFQLELSCSAHSMLAFLADFVRRFLQDQGWFGRNTCISSRASLILLESFPSFAQSLLRLCWFTTNSGHTVKLQCGWLVVSFWKSCNTCSNSWRNTTHSQVQTPHPHANEA